ncbi:cupin [uncultured Croceitalea sp.]|uniref:cupin n=1 Tax=uncultured Croceitalea sp. TaxID=1798908 RepID=UPI0033057647
MKKTSILNNLVYGENYPLVTLLSETDGGRELRVTFKRGQLMRRHKTPYRITVEVFAGEILFSAGDKKVLLKRGDMLSLEGGILHELLAKHNSILRLTQFTHRQNEAVYSQGVLASLN